MTTAEVAEEQGANLASVKLRIRVHYQTHCIPIQHRTQPAPVGMQNVCPQTHLLQHITVNVKDKVLPQTAQLKSLDAESQDPARCSRETAPKQFINDCRMMCADDKGTRPCLRLP
jgi:hypothetical protein